MHRQTASKLLYDALYFNISKKEHAKIHKHFLYTQISINIFLFFFIVYKNGEKNINFDDKKIKKAPSTKTKGYIVLTTLMLIIY